jgi:hypothetical protein
MLFELKRYPFTEYVIGGAPEESGIYVLWENEELTYIGTAGPGGMTIKSRLLDHMRGHDHCSCTPTHYGWRLARNPKPLEQELLAEYQSRFAAHPRCNAKRI